jgi:peptidoglycan/LPS O-acetylase OafA/YrhL
MINPMLRLDCAAWGVLAAWIVRRGSVSRGAAAGFLVLGTVLLGVLGQVWVMHFQAERLVPWGWDVWKTAYEPVHYSAETLAAAFLILGLHRLLPHGKGPIAGFAGATARLSYSLYLVHIPVVYLCRYNGLDDTVDWNARLVMTALVVIAALVLRYGVELPALALRERLAPERDRRLVAKLAATAGR